MGFGLGLLAPSTFMVINSYFSSKRGRAVGVSMAGTGLGQVFMPHVVRIFLEQYGFRTAVLAIALLSLSGLISAFFLKPLNLVKRNNRQHLKLILSNHNKDLKNDNSVMEIKIVNANNVGTNDEKNKGLERALLNENNKVYHECTEKVDKREKFCTKICQRLVEAMDLELLKDPVFWSLIIGMALVYTSAINFNMIFPSFLEVILANYIFLNTVKLLNL